MLKIRLRRMGKRHRPFYRVVVSDSRSVPAAPAVDELGHYDPMTNPPQVRLDLERIEHWTGQGAQLSPTVKKLVKGVRTGKIERATGAEAAAKPSAAAPTPAEPEASAAPAEAEPQPEAAPEAAAAPEAEAAPTAEAAATGSDEAPTEEAAAADQPTAEEAPAAETSDESEAKERAADQ